MAGRADGAGPVGMDRLDVVVGVGHASRGQDEAPPGVTRGAWVLGHLCRAVAERNGPGDRAELARVPTLADRTPAGDLERPLPGSRPPADGVGRDGRQHSRFQGRAARGGSPSESAATDAQTSPPASRTSSAR